MWNYRCERCGCRLDPGEGRICEDCMTKEEREKQLQDMLKGPFVQMRIPGTEEDQAIWMNHS